MKIRDYIELLSDTNQVRIITDTEVFNTLVTELIITKPYLLDYEVTHITPDDFRNSVIYASNTIYTPSEDELEEANRSLEELVKVLRSELKDKNAVIDHYVDSINILNREIDDQDNIIQSLQDEVDKYESALDDAEKELKEAEDRALYWINSYEELEGMLDKLNNDNISLSRIIINNLIKEEQQDND